MSSIIERARKNLAKLNEKTSNFKKTEYWSPRTLKPDSEDYDLVRMICPAYLDNEEHDPWISTAQYSLPTPSGDTHITDAPSFFDMEDPIKELAEELRNGTSDEKEQAKKLRAKDSFIALIVDLKEPERGVQVWRFGAQVMKQLLKYIGDEDYNLFWDVNKGHDIKVKKVKTGPMQWDVEYDVKLRPKPSPLENSEALLAEASQIDLARVIKVETPETLMEILEGKYDWEVALARRKERDAAFRPPIPYFIQRDSDMTKEEVENRKRVEEEDANFDPDTGKQIDPLLAAETKFSGKRVKFKYRDENSEEAVDAEGAVTAIEREEGSERIILVVNYNDELFEVYTDMAEIAPEPVEKAAPRKAAKTEKQSGVMSKLDAMKKKRSEG